MTAIHYGPLAALLSWLEHECVWPDNAIEHAQTWVDALRAVIYGEQAEGLVDWVKTQPPEVVAARLKQLDDALGHLLDDEAEHDLRQILGGSGE